MSPTLDVTRIATVHFSIPQFLIKPLSYEKIKITKLKDKYDHKLQKKKKKNLINLRAIMINGLTWQNFILLSARINTDEVSGLQIQRRPLKTAS